MPISDYARLFEHDDGDDIGFRQGVVIAWDPDTFANTIDVGDTQLANLPTLSGPDALTYQPGQAVGLLRVRSQYFIIGRILVPGAGAGEAAIDWMTTSLADALAATVFAGRIHSAVVQASESTTSSAYTDLATVGPVVADVPITSTGRAIVHVSCLMLATSDGVMSYEISGATTRAVAADGALEFFPSGGGLMDGTRTVLVQGLNEGLHTFTAKYRSPFGDSTSYAERTLVVIAF